jgi:uncharacterized protein YecT (DUF1311 family)
MRLVLFLLLMLPAMPALAEDEWPYQAECRKWADVPIPPQDIGTAPADCDTPSLYYGVDGQGRDKDFVAARHCAYKAPKDGDSLLQNGSMFDGSGVLMVLYANGQGVERNIPLAKRFACEYGGAPAEIEGRLAHLDAIADGTDKEHFDICDDITSGMMMGFCSGRAAEFAQFIRNERWTALQADWTPAQRSALAALRKAADAYFEGASGNEVDLSGTARAAFETDAYETLDIALLDDVQRFEKGARPDEKAGDFASADKALNIAYRKTISELDADEKANKAKNIWMDGEISSDGVRETERLWLPYRDAWVKFAAARYTDTPADAWRAWLSKARTKALTSIINPE